MKCSVPAVRHAFAVGLVQGVRHLDGVLEHLLQRERTFRQPLGQRFALQVLHHQEIDSVLMSDVVEDADVRMIQSGDRPRFAVEALAHVGPTGKVCGQHLDGYDAVEPRVAGLIHLSHAPGADERDDFVGAESVSYSECHVSESAKFTPSRSG
jgi:hypothetical protein